MTSYGWYILFTRIVEYVICYSDKYSAGVGTSNRHTKSGVLSHTRTDMEAMTVLTVGVTSPFQHKI